MYIHVVCICIYIYIYINILLFQCWQESLQTIADSYSNVDKRACKLLRILIPTLTRELANYCGFLFQRLQESLQDIADSYFNVELSSPQSFASSLVLHFNVEISVRKCCKLIWSWACRRPLDRSHTGLHRCIQYVQVRMYVWMHAADVVTRAKGWPVVGYVCNYIYIYR